MLQGQKLRDKQGNQIALFPLDLINITQGENGQFSHQGSLAIDFVGTSTRYPYYAPCDLTLILRVDVGSYVYQSDKPVRWSDNTLDYITLWIVHDNTDYSQGRKVKQGDFLGRTGTAGYVTGDHLHLEVAKGKYSGMFQNTHGVWLLKNQVSMIKVFSINNTNIVNGFGYNWTVYQGGLTPPPNNFKKKKGLPIWLVGSKTWN